MLAFLCANPIPSKSRSKYALYMAFIDTHLKEMACKLLIWLARSLVKWSGREMPAVAASDHHLPLQLMARRMDSKDAAISSQAWLLY
jgi:hypothetical protein